MLMEIKKLKDENKTILDNQKILMDLIDENQVGREKEVEEALLEPLTTLEEFDEKERVLEGQKGERKKLVRINKNCKVFLEETPCTSYDR